MLWWSQSLLSMLFVFCIVSRVVLLSQWYFLVVICILYSVSNLNIGELLTFISYQLSWRFNFIWRWSFTEHLYFSLKFFRDFRGLLVFFGKHGFKISKALFAEKKSTTILPKLFFFVNTNTPSSICFSYSVSGVLLLQFRFSLLRFQIKGYTKYE